MAYAAAAAVVVQIVALAVSTAIAVAPTPADRQRRERIKQLSERMGLTDDEKRVMQQAILDPIRAQEREVFRRQGEIAANQRLTGGQLANFQRASADRLQSGRARGQRQLLAADLMARDQDKRELDALLEGASASQRAKFSAIAEANAYGAGLGADQIEQGAYARGAGVDPAAGAEAHRARQQNVLTGTGATTGDLGGVKAESSNPTSVFTGEIGGTRNEDVRALYGY